MTDFNPTIDAAIEAVADANLNLGGLTVVNVGALYIGGEKAFQWRGLFFFDVSSLGPVTVSTAKLKLYDTGTTGNTVAARVIRLVRDIVEDEVTWNDATDIQEWSTPGAGHENEDRNPDDPAEVAWTLPAGQGAFEITGLAAHVQWAIDEESGIVRLQLVLEDEDPGSNARAIIASKEHAFNPIPVLEVIHDGTGRRRIPAQVI